jgi:predicted  nucleic acid-binding Zn-ribbon protein
VASFLDRLFGKKPEEPVLVIDYTGIAQWLDEQEIEGRNEMIGQTAAPRAAITRAVDDARNQVNRLRMVEISVETNPKLKRVVETSLQPFVRAMDITLSRHFSSDPVEFYNDSAEVLKGCMKHMNGQGKYIAAVLPEEMKELRSSIGVIGMEVNKMTKEIARAERIVGQTQDARAAYRKLEEAVGEYAAKRDQWERIWKDISKAENRLKTINGKMSEIETDENYVAVGELQRQVTTLEKEQEVLGGRYHILASTAGGVLRRAAYAAERQGSKESAQHIRKVMDLLDQPVDQGCDIIVRSVRAIMPEIRAMVDDTSVVLKNKDELHLFSSESALAGELEGICTRYNAIREEIDAAKAGIARSGSRSVMDDLEQRRENIQEKHQGDIDRMAAYEKEMEAIKAEIPRLNEELEARIVAIAGEGARIELRGMPCSEDDPSTEP